MTNTLENLLQNLKCSDLESLYIVIDAYKEAGSPEIMEGGIGMNMNSGYVYIALENGIQIASCFGQSVDYLVYDFESGDEFYFETYDEAEDYLNKL
jgi:hypothetical protein